MDVLKVVSRRFAHLFIPHPWGQTENINLGCVQILEGWDQERQQEHTDLDSELGGLLFAALLWESGSQAGILGLRLETHGESCPRKKQGQGYWGCV